MPWVSLLFLLAAAYILILVFAGIGQMIPWILDRLGGNHRDTRTTEAHTIAHDKSKEPQRRGSRLAMALLQKTYRLADSLSGLGSWFGRKDYTYWMSLALGETDLNKKMKYCVAALKRKPDCDSAWAIRANALLRLKKYDEAVIAFEHVLQLRPSATAWYEKGQCHFHLGQHAEAVRCFDQALAAYHEPGQNFIDEVSRIKQRAEAAAFGPS